MIWMYLSDPAQYTCLISFTPVANKPGELHRISMLVIEIGSYLTIHNSRMFEIKTVQIFSADFYTKCLKPLLRTHLFSDSLIIDCSNTHSSLSAANFLTAFWKSKVFPPFPLRSPQVLQKQSPPRFGLLRRKYLWGSILFTKTLLFSNPISRPGCYD